MSGGRHGGEWESRFGGVGLPEPQVRAAVLGRPRTESSSPGTQEAAEKDNLLNGSRLNSQTVPLTASNVAQAPKGLPGSIFHPQPSVGMGSRSP